MDTWTVTNLEKSQSGCKQFERHQECVGEVPLHFQFLLNTTGVLHGTADKKFNGKRLGEHEGCTRTTVLRYIVI